MFGKNQSKRITEGAWEIGFSGEEKYAVVTLTCTNCGTVTRWFGTRRGIGHVPVAHCCGNPPAYPQSEKFLAHLALTPQMPKEPSRKTASPVLDGRLPDDFIHYVKADPGF
jgi:hypothetical protein